MILLLIFTETRNFFVSWKDPLLSDTEKLRSLTKKRAFLSLSEKDPFCLSLKDLSWCSLKDPCLTITLTLLCFSQKDLIDPFLLLTERTPFFVTKNPIFITNSHRKESLFVFYSRVFLSVTVKHHNISHTARPF